MQQAFVWAVLTACCALPPTAIGAVKHTAVKPVAKTGAVSAGRKAPAKGASKGAGKASGAKTVAATSAGRKGGHPAIATRLVRTKSGRLTRVAVHAPPPPSYQTHPDPERYAEIQKALADRGYFKGEPNGEWGDDSVDALRRFQAQSNLPDDGKISSLSLIGLGLGPRHDGTSASSVPSPAAPLAAPVTATAVGPVAAPPVPPASSSAIPPPL